MGHPRAVVTVALLPFTLVLIAARSLSAACPPSDGNGDGRVSINEIVVVVRAALEGCERPPEDRFTHRAGVVEDNQTGLVWEALGCEEPQGLTYTEAEAHAAAANRNRLGGRQDWRVPSLSDWGTLRQGDYPVDGFEASACPCSGAGCNQSPEGYFWTASLTAPEFSDRPGHLILWVEGWEIDNALDTSAVGAVRLVAGP